MKKTEKLYETDGHLSAFDAKVLSCERTKDGYAVVLDRTAFFPEGGGQYPDRGVLGGRTVLDVQIREGIVLHTLDGSLEVGMTVHGEIDSALRLRRMQNHTGEHIVSGIVHALYGYDNVGFHLGDDGVTIDFNGALTREQLLEVERLANIAVYRNMSVTVSYPTSKELSRLAYRSKLDLTEDVRIVTIGDVDCCACCAPHVSKTGEIGEIKLLDFIKYKGGIRLQMLCGEDARCDHHARYLATAAVSQLLSVKQNEIEDGVRRMCAREETLKGEIRSLKLRLLEARVNGLSYTDGNRVLLEPSADMELLRELANRAVGLAGGVTVVLAGDDASGYRYVIASRSTALRSAAGEINSSLNGRGGGTDEMVQGSFLTSYASIEAFFANDL